MTGVIALSLLALLSAAEPDALRKARAEIDNANFEAAVKVLDRALKDKHSPENVAKIQLMRARCFMALQQRPQTRAALAAALKAEPETELDPERFSPELVDLLQQVREENAQPVTIKSDATAQVRVDGRLLGPTPLTARLAPGKRLVELRVGEQSKVHEISVKLEPGQVFDLEAPPPAPDKPVVVAEPSAKETPRTGPTTVESAPSRERKGSALPWVGIASGTVLTAAGLVATFSAVNTKAGFDRQQSPSVTPTVTRADASRAQLLFPIGIGAAGAGVALLAISAVSLAGGDDDEAVAFGAFGGPDGAFASVELRF